MVYKAVQTHGADEVPLRASDSLGIRRALSKRLPYFIICRRTTNRRPDTAATRPQRTPARGHGRIAAAHGGRASQANRNFRKDERVRYTNDQQKNCSSARKTAALL